jgi:hypothetical protein
MSSSRAVQRGRLRIIGGQWKKRLIRFNGAADLSEEAQFDPERINRFKSVITDLYKVIYESTMTAVSGEQRNRGPDKPIYDPDADNGESYGRVRLWVRELRNYYQHDVQSRKGWGGMNLPAHCGRGGTSYTASIAGPNRQAHFRNQTLGSQKWVICPERNGQQPVCFVLRKR